MKGLSISDPERLRRALVLVALVLFVLSLGMPCIKNPTGWNSDSCPGWVCLLFGFPFYPSNLLLVLSMLTIGGASDPDHMTRRRVYVGLYTVSTAFVLWPYFGGGRRDVLDGYYMWAAAHCLVTAAFWVPARDDEADQPDEPAQV
jgi:peptidoglycan/LPS O-acetylase OafA/YrhL